LMQSRAFYMFMLFVFFLLFSSQAKRQYVGFFFKKKSYV
jgi:hypothetical protein